MAPAFQLSAVSQEDCCCRADQLGDHRPTRAHHLLKPAQGSDEGDKSQVIITQLSSALVIFLSIKSSLRFCHVSLMVCMQKRAFAQ